MFLLFADIMKFHYLSQLLVDSNCLLLILKMFGLQEVTTSIKAKNDRPDHKFVLFLLQVYLSVTYPLRVRSNQLLQIL